MPERKQDVKPLIVFLMNLLHPIAPAVDSSPQTTNIKDVP